MPIKISINISGYLVVEAQLSNVLFLEVGCFGVFVKPLQVGRINGRVKELRMVLFDAFCRLMHHSESCIRLSKVPV